MMLADMLAPHENPDIGVEKVTDRAYWSVDLIDQRRALRARMSASKTRSGCAGKKRSFARFAIYASS